MQLVDLNLLIYAVNRDAPRHRASREWLERALSGDEPVGFAWNVLVGFLRIATHRRILPRPLTGDEALAVIDDWLACPRVEILGPGRQHWSILRALLEESGAAGNLTADAHLAAIAIENGCVLQSTDTDFRRFRHLRWSNPIDEELHA